MNNNLYYLNPFYFLYKSKDLLEEINKTEELKEDLIATNLKMNSGITIALFIGIVIYSIIYISLLIASFYYVIKANILKKNNTPLHIGLLIVSIIFANPFWIIYYIYLIYTRHKSLKNTTTTIVVQGEPGKGMSKYY